MGISSAEFCDAVTTFLVVQHIPHPCLRVALAFDEYSGSPCGSQLIISQAYCASSDHVTWHLSDLCPSTHLLGVTANPRDR